MTKCSLRLPHALLLFLVGGCAPLLAAQDTGPMAPPPPAPASQPAAQKPTDPAAGTADSGTVTAPAPTSGTGASAGGSAAPVANGTTSNPSVPAAAGATVVPVATAAAAKIMVPSGTHIPLVLHNAISTRSARPGDPVYFETLFPVMIDGKVVIPAGSYVSGEVTESKRPGRVKGRGELMIKLTTMILPNAYEVNLAAAPSNAGTGGGETTNSEGTIVGDSDKASDAGTIIRSTEAGTAIGAGVGAAAGHIGEGVGVGAGAGAAAGLMAVLLTRGPDAELPRGTTLEAVLDRPIMLDADKVQFTSPGTSTALSGPPNREPQRQKVPF